MRWIKSRMLLVLTLALLTVAARSQATEVIFTIAGGGTLEDYKPLEANIDLGNNPGLLVSPLGEVVFSDTNHHQVLKVNPTTGRITIVAGNGTQAHNGDGTPAPSAGLNRPGGLALDA